MSSAALELGDAQALVMLQRCAKNVLSLCFPITLTHTVMFCIAISPEQ
jgi:hypothetical protein